MTFVPAVLGDHEEECCPNCGRSVEVDDRHCGACGLALESSRVQQVDQLLTRPRGRGGAGFHRGTGIG